MKTNRVQIAVGTFRICDFGSEAEFKFPYFRVVLEIKDKRGQVTHLDPQEVAVVIKESP